MMITPSRAFLVCCFMLVVLSALLTSGHAVFVDAVHGSDAPSCGRDIASACRSLNYAVQNTTANDDLVLLPGVYSGHENVPLSLVTKSQVHATRIQGLYGNSSADTTIDCGNVLPCISAYGVASFQLANLRMVSGDAHGAPLLNGVSAVDIQLAAGRNVIDSVPQVQVHYGGGSSVRRTSAPMRTQSALAISSDKDVRSSSFSAASPTVLIDSVVLEGGFSHGASECNWIHVVQPVGVTGSQVSLSRSVFTNNTMGTLKVVSTETDLTMNTMVSLNTWSGPYQANNMLTISGPSHISQNLFTGFTVLHTAPNRDGSILTNSTSDVSSKFGTNVFENIDLTLAQSALVSVSLTNGTYSMTGVNFTNIQTVHPVISVRDSSNAGIFNLVSGVFDQVIVSAGSAAPSNTIVATPVIGVKVGTASLTCVQANGVPSFIEFIGNHFQLSNSVFTDNTASSGAGAISLELSCADKSSIINGVHFTPSTVLSNSETYGLFLNFKTPSGCATSANHSAFEVTNSTLDMGSYYLMNSNPQVDVIFLNDVFNTDSNSQSISYCGCASDALASINFSSCVINGGGDVLSHTSCCKYQCMMEDYDSNCVALENKKDHTTMWIIIGCVIGVVALCGIGALVYVFVIKKKRNTGYTPLRNEVSDQPIYG